MASGPLAEYVFLQCDRSNPDGSSHQGSIDCVEIRRLAEAMTSSR